MLIASSLRKEFSGDPLFEGVSFSVGRRDRLSLAGPNGAGKTTLLRAIAGETSLQGGELAFAKGTRVALHDQRPPRDLIYSGIEAAFGGWITEYTRRLATDSSSMRWETAASAFWGGLAGGRGIVATGVARRVEDFAVIAGLVMVGIAIASLLAVPHVSLVFAVAVICGLGFAPSFPVTMAGLSREVPPKVAQPMIALGSLGAGIVPWMVGAISSRTGSLTAGLSALLVLLAVLDRDARPASKERGAASRALSSAVTTGR